MPDDVVRQVLSIQIDKNAANLTNREVAKLNAVTVDWRKEVQAADRALSPFEAKMAKYGKTAQAVARESDKIAKSLRDERKAANSLKREIDGVTKAEKERARIARDSAGIYGDVESRTRALTGAVGYVGGESGAKVERAANVGAELLASVEAIKLLKLELPALASNLNLSWEKILLLSAAAVASGAALLVAKDGLDGIKGAAQNARNETIGMIEGLKDFYDFSSDATTQDAKEKIESVRKEREQNALLYADLAKLQAAIESGLDVSDQGAIDAFAEGTLRFLDTTGLLNFGLDEVKDAMSEVTVENKALDTQFRLLVQAYLENAFAANDAKVAAEELAAVEKQLAAERSGQLLATTQLQIKAAQMTEEQTKKRLEQIEIERQYYGALVNDLKLLAPKNEEYASALERAEKQLGALTAEEEILTNLRFTEARQLAAFTQIQEKAVRNYGDQSKAFGEAVKEITKATESAQKYADEQAKVDADRALSANREQEDFLRQRNQDLADHYADLADLDTDYYVDRQGIINDALEDLATVEQDRADELRSLNRDLEYLARDHADNMRKITRDANRDQQSAASRLDAVALREAQIRLTDTVEDEETQYQKEKDIREDDYQERVRLLDRERAESLNAQKQSLRDLEQKHQNERRSNEMAFRLELDRQDEENRIKLQRQQEDYTIEDAQRKAHYEVELSDNAVHYQNLVNIHQSGMAAAEQVVAQSYARISSIASQSTVIQNALSSSRTSIGTAASRIPTTLSPLSYSAPTTRGSTTIGDVIINIGGKTPTTQSPGALATTIRNEFERMITRD